MNTIEENGKIYYAVTFIDEETKFKLYDLVNKIPNDPKVPLLVPNRPALSIEEQKEIKKDKRVKNNFVSSGWSTDMFEAIISNDDGERMHIPFLYWFRANSISMVLCSGENDKIICCSRTKHARIYVHPYEAPVSDVVE